jgi:TorA maturation chaperone TorD
MYGLFLDAFVALPDRALVSEMQGCRFDGLLFACKELGGQRLERGAALVDDYRSRVKTEDVDEILRELSVDRARLLGMTGSNSFSPPYERFYAAGFGHGSAVLGDLRGFYRRADLLLAGSAGEADDFLFVEVDFARQMCLREAEAWPRDSDGRAFQMLELRFLKEHPARWAGLYCGEAERHAGTDFYRGLLAILEGFLESERTYLEEAGSEPRSEASPCDPAGKNGPLAGIG